MAPSEPAVLGVDAGTTSAKAVAFTLDGSTLAVARRPVTIRQTASGIAEVSLDHVWDVVKETIEEVVGIVRRRGYTIAAIGVTGQGDGAWFLDAKYEPLRPAVLWLDARATERLREWQDDGRASAVTEATGSSLFPGALPILIDELDITGPVMQVNCKDWIRFRLTGHIATDFSDASRSYLDTARLGRPDALFTALGQEHVRSWLPPLHDATELAGTVTAEAAAATGLSAQTPVVIGMFDVAAMAVGLGCLDARTPYAIVGTTGFVGVLRETRSHLPAAAVTVIATGRGGEVIEALAPMTGTPNLDWAGRVIGGSGGHGSPLTREDEAATAPAGSNGVIYLPYGSPGGERAPFVDGAASAGWFGLNTTITSGDLLRSVYEGLAYGVVECLRILGGARQLMISGGGANSNLFCQILADVGNLQVIRQVDAEVGARGAAMLAAVGSGMLADISSASQTMRPSQTVFEPAPEATMRYEDLFATFLALRDAIRPQWPALRALRPSD